MVSSKIKDNIKYNWAWALNPVQPLILWNDAVKSLEKFYNRPKINLKDSPKDVKIKNDMRHIVGAALVAKTYSPLGVRPITNVKETMDICLDFIKHPKSGISKDVLNDTNIDYKNNGIGRDYIKNNPFATKDEIINYAYERAIKNYEQDYNLKQGEKNIPVEKKFKNNSSDNGFKPIKLSDINLESLANYHKSLGEVFDRNNSEMVAITLNSSEYKELERLSKYGYSPLQTSELFTKADNINLKEYSKDGVSAYDTLYANLGHTTIMGKTIKQALSDLISSDEYKNLPDYSSDISQSSKVSVIDDIFTNYTNHARIRMINDVPDFADSSGGFLSKSKESFLTDSRAYRLEEHLERDSELIKYFV